MNARLSLTLNAAAILADGCAVNDSLSHCRFCEYPQEIGLAFVDGVVSISQIQLLSHQSKITTRIELFMGVGADYMHASFTRLGYLSLDSNERSDYKVRVVTTAVLHFLWSSENPSIPWVHWVIATDKSKQALSLHVQARELKSVYIKARGSFFKLIIHKCYINPLNLFNQVRAPVAFAAIAVPHEAAFARQPRTIVDL